MVLIGRQLIQDAPSQLGSMPEVRDVFISFHENLYAPPQCSIRETLTNVLPVVISSL